MLVPILGVAKKVKTAGPSLTTKAPAAHGGPAQFIHRGPSGAQSFALTFHGAGDLVPTRAILATTKRLSVPITVFAVGTWVEQHKDLIREMVAAGHELANHTQTHPALRRVDRAGVAAEITGCANALRQVTGSIGAWFRPSGTPTPTTMMLEEAAKAGYSTVVGYDVDPLDYQDPGTDAIASRVVADTRAGSIVSLHLGHPGTAGAIEAIVHQLRKKGLTAVTVSTLLRG